MYIKQLFFRSLFILLGFLYVSELTAQIDDGDWLLFEAEQSYCFQQGECWEGFIGIFGNVASDSCVDIDYALDYRLFLGDFLFWEKKNTKNTFIDILVVTGQFELIIDGTDGCGNTASDTLRLEVIGPCGPPFAWIKGGEAHQVTETNSVSLNAVQHFYDDFGGQDCLQGGYIDTLRIKISDGLNTPTNLLDTMMFAAADTGYYEIELWEHSWGDWYLTASTWIHIYLPYDNTISGTVYYDQNENCHFDDGEVGLEDRLIYFSNFLTSDTTDMDGSYDLKYPIPTNPFYTRSTYLFPIIETGCIADTTFTNAMLDQGGLEMDWGVQLKPDCHELQVNIGTPFLRRCFESTYIISYCNVGTEQADSAYIEVLFDPALTPLSSTLDWASQDGQLYTFFLDTVPGGACGTFNVQVMVDCENTTLGQLHCTEAHIYPDETCIDTMGIWQGGNIEVRAACDSDSVRFNIKNTGQSPTSIPLDYFIVEDDIIIFFQSFDPLGPGDSLHIGLPKTGAYYYVQSEQEPFHPFDGNPSAFIEGCASQSDSLSVGFAGQFPLYDPEPFLDIDCTENIGAFDPNDKQAHPIGYTNNHFVEPGDLLTYKIRFQNTGTDTAFNIRIVDTLSEHLLYGTFDPLVASHPYTFEISPEGVATFYFENIMLADSNINEAASHGFVTFDIRLRDALEPETMIFNDADIYFDFNEPIRTNLVDHQIKPDFAAQLFTSVEPPIIAPSPDYWTMTISPNPITQNGIIKINHPTASKVTRLEIYDALGRLSEVLNTDEDGQAKINSDKYGAGIYFIKALQEDIHLTSGKVVIER